jgi:CDP-paratose 2-epimerase
MAVVIVTGAAGLIGSEAVRHFSTLGMHVVGIDNGMRSYFFGEEASTAWMQRQLQEQVRGYEHYSTDIRSTDEIARIVKHYGREIALVIHTAAQPSHDWAAREPLTDFSVNATGTLGILEATRQYAPDAVFIFTSTNKVYGDLPNSLPLIENETRWEINTSHEFRNGISKKMSIDRSMHSIFGASKVAADVMVQEYGRYFGIKSVCFRGGCLTGPNHSGAQLQGFLVYLMKCCVTGIPYKVFGYKGEQVRDNIHSLDLISAFEQFFRNPRSGEVYNIGGSRYSNCSMIEAIELCQRITGRELRWEYVETSRAGDHIWWISDVSRFQRHYPGWQLTYDVPAILKEIHAANAERWSLNASAVPA